MSELDRLKAVLAKRRGEHFWSSQVVVLEHVSDALLAVAAAAVEEASPRGEGVTRPLLDALTALDEAIRAALGDEP